MVVVVALEEDDNAPMRSSNESSSSYSGHDCPAHSHAGGFAGTVRQPRSNQSTMGESWENLGVDQRGSRSLIHPK